MKKHLNRIAVDLCTPTLDRRPTTAEDIRNDVFIEDFRSSEELYEFVLDLTNMSDEDVIDELGGNDTIVNKINYLISLCTDPGDGSPNILYCCVDGKQLDDVVEYDAFDGLDFDSVDSQTLVDILLAEHYYEDDDDDEEWDEEKEIKESKTVDNKNSNSIRIKIYNAKIETTPYIFEPWGYAKEQFNLNRDYKLVGEGEIEIVNNNYNKMDFLEDLFIALNVPNSKNKNINLDNFKYNGHSLSISDVIYFVDDNEYYYVDNVGFVKILEK